MNAPNQSQIERPLAYGRQAEIFDWGPGQVLKLFLGNWPEAVRHEYHGSQLAYSQGVQTPQPVAMVEQEGRPGIVFEKVEGTSLLRLLGMRPWYVWRMARQFAALHHTVHACKAAALPDARPSLENTIRAEQQLSRDTQSALLEILARLEDGDSLLHGDFHPDNVMVTAKGMVIIDWPDAARGCPLADVARTTIMLRFGEPVGKTSLGFVILSRFLRGIFRSAYLRAYFQNSPYGPDDLPSWEIVRAAHRIGDRIPGEEEKLIQFIKRNLSIA